MDEQDCTPISFDDMPGISALKMQRAMACRLTPDLALMTLEEACEFVVERGMITRTADCSLPSLFEACHEEPYMPGKGGFAAYPKTKWWWAGALTEQPGIYYLKIHQGKGIYLSQATVALIDPLCQEELDKAANGAYGTKAALLVAHLAAAGSSLVEDLKVELGYDTATLRSVRNRLERVGAVVSRQTLLEASNGGHRHSSELLRWDQAFHSLSQPPPGGISELLVAGVRAAVLVPEEEVKSWFSWPVSSQTIDSLVKTERLWRPEPGWLAMAPYPSLSAAQG